MSSPRSAAAALAVVFGLLLVVGALPYATGCGGGGDEWDATGKASSAADVVARVDGVPVTRAEVDQVRAEARLEGRKTNQDAGLAEAVRRVLVRREAQRLGVTVDAAALHERIEAIEESAGGSEALSAALAAAGATHAQLIDSVRYALVRDGLLASKFARLRPFERAVRSFYRRRAADLFTRSAAVRLADVTVPSKALARQLRAKVADGASFASLARKYSMDSSTRFDGGMLGWISVPTLPEQSRAAIAGLAPGEVTRPFMSVGRWHLYKVYGRRAASAMPFVDVASGIRAELGRRRRAAALDAWLRRAHAHAGVEIVH